MYRQFYDGMSLVHLPLFTLALFVLVFTGAVIRTFVFRRAKDFDEVSRLPMGDGHE